MTLQQLVEMVRAVHPSVPETQVRIELNSAYKLFQRVSRSMVAAVDTPVQDGEYEYPLPQEVMEVRDMYPVNNSGERQTVDGQRFDVEGYTLRVYQENGDPLTSYPDGWDQLRIDAYWVPTAMTDPAHTPSIPEEFHPALAYKVLADLALKAGNVQGWSAFNAEWKSLLREAKVMAARKGDATSYTATPVSYP